MWELGIDDNLLADDTAFDRQTARELYRLGFGDAKLSARWSRATDPEVIRFVDIVNEIHGRAEANGMISCPFHGRDSHPSFKLYPDGAWCFGCPHGQQYYDTVKFVAAKFGYTPLQAIVWLEKKYGLPQLEGDEYEEEDEETEDGNAIVSLNFHDLAGPYIKTAARAFQQSLDVELAHEYITIFFESMPGRKEDPNSTEALQKAVGLARVLGWKAVEEIKKQRLR